MTLNIHNLCKLTSLQVGLNDCDIGGNDRAVSGEVDILDASSCRGKADSLVHVNADIGKGIVLILLILKMIV